MTEHGVPVAEGLFTWGDEGPHLLASRCAFCNLAVFPMQRDCPRCMGEHMDRLELPRRGVLWTFSTQEFPPKAPPYAAPETPETFPSYSIGYVEFKDLLRVEGRLTTADPERLRIGMETETVVVPFATAEDGRPLLTYAFQPVES